jgi:hypothetical protein
MRTCRETETCIQRRLEFFGNIFFARDNHDNLQETPCKFVATWKWPEDVAPQLSQVLTP